MSIGFEKFFVMQGQYIALKLWFATNYIGVE